MFNIEAATSIADLRVFMKNAKSKERLDLYWRAFSRLCDLESPLVAEPLAEDFWKATAAVEELLYVKHGKRVLAQRTRQKVKKVGVWQCLYDWVMRPTETEGFQMLMEAGLSRLTGEAIVVKHADLFPEEAIAAATIRLKKYSVV